MRNRRAIVILAIAVVGMVALAAYSYQHGIGPFARGTEADTPMELAAASYPCGGGDAVKCAGGVCTVDEACPAMAEDGACQVAAASPAVAGGKCAGATSCVCPGDGKGCTGNCAACPVTKEAACQAAKSGKCGGTPAQAPQASQAQTCQARAAGGCPMAQAESAKKTSCQTSCPFSSK